MELKTDSSEIRLWGTLLVRQLGRQLDVMVQGALGRFDGDWFDIWQGLVLLHEPVHVCSQFLWVAANKRKDLPALVIKVEVGSRANVPFGQQVLHDTHARTTASLPPGRHEC